MKYSIIIPTNNRPENIVKRLNELEKLKDSEIIIIENNSRNPRDYQKLYLPDNAMLIHIKTKGIGTGKARNVGISKAQGDYLFFLDDDDTPTEEFIGVLNGATFVEDVYRFGIEYLKKINFPSFTSKVIKMTKFDEVKPMSFLIRRTFLIKNKIIFDEKVIHQDLLFNSMIWNTHIKQKVLKIPSIKYCMGNLSLTRSKYNRITEMKSINSLIKHKSEFWFLVIDNNCHRLKNNKIELRKLISSFKSLASENKWTFRKLPFYYKIKYIIFKLRRTNE